MINMTVLPMDTASRRWLIALAIAFFVAAAMLTHSFMNAFSAPERGDAKVQPVGADRPEEIHTVSQPEWIHPQEFQGVEQRHAPTDDAITSDSRDTTTREKSETLREKMVHKQAESLRSLVKQNKLPAAYGHLTLDQIDDMEKKGIVIE